MLSQIINKSDYCSSTIIALFCGFLMLGGFSPVESAVDPMADMLQAPALKLETLSGTKIDLTDYRGQVVLVSFWASWCPPCIHEMPSIERLARNMADKPLKIILVNVNEPAEVLRRFSGLTNAGIVMLRDPDGEVAEGWDVSIYPTSYIIDANQNIPHRVLGPTDWDSIEWAFRIQDLLPKPAPQTLH